MSPVPTKVAEPTPAAKRARPRKTATAPPPDTAPAAEPKPAPAPVPPAPRRPKKTAPPAPAPPADEPLPVADEPLHGFSDAEHELLDATGTPEDRAGRALLWRTALRTGLDPFDHLYLRKDWSKAAKKDIYSVGCRIDGFRLVAKSQTTYEGQTRTRWFDDKGTIYDVWAQDRPPAGAIVGVYVAGYREAMYGIARYSEYRPKTASANSNWTTMPALMIAKVAEALAIRKSYPELLAGVYTSEEMAQRAVELREVEITGSPIAAAFDREALASEALAAVRANPEEIDNVYRQANDRGVIDEPLPDEGMTLREALHLIWGSDALAAVRANPEQIDNVYREALERGVIDGPLPDEGMTLREALHRIWCSEALAYAKAHPQQLDGVRRKATARTLINTPLPDRGGLTLAQALDELQAHLTGQQPPADPSPAAPPASLPASPDPTANVPYISNTLSLTLPGIIDTPAGDDAPLDHGARCDKCGKTELAGAQIELVAGRNLCSECSYDYRDDYGNDYGEGSDLAYEGYDGGGNPW